LKEYKDTEIFMHNASQSRSQLFHTVDTEEKQTLKQGTSN